MPDADTPSPGSTSIGPSIIFGIAALIDIALLQAWVKQDLSMLSVMALHLVLSLGIGGLLHALCGRSVSKTLARMVILVLFGPFGGPALVAIAPGLPQPKRGVRSDRPVKESRPCLPERGAAEELFDQICQHRRHPLPKDMAPSFLQTFREGTLSQQQQAIAAISQHYNRRMRPALSAALASPVPALRVQASAVYARLRGSYGLRAKAMLAEAGSRPDQSAILEVAASGFVDEDTRKALLRLASSEARWASSPEEPKTRSALLAMPRLKHHACGGLA